MERAWTQPDGRREMKHGWFLLALLWGACMLFAAGPAAAQGQAGPSIVCPSAVWNPSTETMASVRKKCATSPPKLEDCFLAEMQSAGAFPEAVAFAKSFARFGVGYLRALREAGRVSIAYVEYAFRANETEGVILVNGDPPWINVDDDITISQEQFRRNSAILALKNKFPGLSIWPGDRFDTQLPVASALPSGGQKFIVEYLLQDGCHACARVGTAKLSFEFDAGGKFQKTELVSVTPSGAGMAQ
jgi:hypothetical protein